MNDSTTVLQSESARRATRADLHAIALQMGAEVSAWTPEQCAAFWDALVEVWPASAQYEVLTCGEFNPTPFRFQHWLNAVLCRDSHAEADERWCDWFLRTKGRP